MKQHRPGVLYTGVFQYANESITTVAAAAAQALETVRRSDGDQRLQGIAAYRRCQRLVVADAALPSLRVICRHAASSISKLISAADDPQYQHMKEVCQGFVAPSSGLYSAWVTSMILSKLTTNLVVATQHYSSSEIPSRAEVSVCGAHR